MLQGGRDAAFRSLLLVVALLFAMAVGPLPASASTAIPGEQMGGLRLTARRSWSVLTCTGWSLMRVGSPRSCTARMARLRQQPWVAPRPVTTTRLSPRVYGTPRRRIRTRATRPTLQRRLRRLLAVPPQPGTPPSPRNPLRQPRHPSRGVVTPGEPHPTQTGHRVARHRGRPSPFPTNKPPWPAVEYSPNEDITLHAEFCVLLFELGEPGPFVDVQTLGLAPLDPVLLHPVPQRARVNPQIVGYLHDPPCWSPKQSAPRPHGTPGRTSFALLP